MAKYLFGRLLQAIPTVFLVLVLVFLMLHFIPGDPAEIFLGEAPTTPELLERVREQMGLNLPLHQQFLNYIGDVLRGDLGRSLNDKRDVLKEIMRRIPYTAELTVSGLVIGSVLGVALGIFAALNHGNLLDSAAMILALVGISMPIFWSAPLMIVLFSVNLGWFPPLGQGDLNQLVMPALTLGFLSAGSLARLTRSSMLEVIQQEYVLTARAKGLKGRVIILRHALRNALIPVVTVLGLTFGTLMAGAVLTETIFSRLGLGSMYFKGVSDKDFTLVQGMTLFIAIFYILINIVTDLLYALIDPRIRYD